MKHSIPIPTLYGFRSNHATLHTLIDIVTNAYDNLQNNCFTAFLLLDLKKAFDTVSHDILLNKLEHYGIHGVAKNLFSSFLEHRQQLVTINHYKSSKMTFKYGVPQGSVLGPFLFLLYINDLPNCTARSPKLFADDTYLILADPFVQNLKTKISEELQKITNWVNANKLTPNFAKSSIIIVPPKSNVTKLPDFYNSSDQVKVSIVSESKYLGIILDKDLSFLSHIKKLENKLSKSVGIFNKVKPFLNASILLQLYYSIFNSYRQHGITMWGSTFKSYLKKLNTLQNKAVKIQAGELWRERATPF